MDTLSLRVSRREFLKGTAATAASLVLNQLGPSFAASATGRTRRPAPPAGPLLLSFHLDGFDVQYDWDQTEAAFTTIQDLGGNSLRTHLWWFDLEPAMGQWDTARIEWYRRYFRTAVQSFGLTPLAVLVGLPLWAVALFQREKTAFLDHWRRYCEQVIDLTEGHVQLIQIWNEPNNGLQGLLDPRYINLGHLPPAGFATLCQLTSDTLRSAHPFELAVNVAADQPNWQSFITSLLTDAPDAVDMLGVDFYPRTWSTHATDDWHPLATLLKRVSDPHDIWYGKTPAIIETGYSTFIPRLKSEEEQERWINVALPAIRELNQASVAQGGAGLRMLGWYKLFNDHDEQPFNALAHFGILRQRDLGAPLIRKLAYDALRCQLHALRFESP